MSNLFESEAGSLTLELVVLTPVIVVFLLFVSGAAALQGARGDVDDAAWEAARAASLARSPALAEAAARQAVVRRLGEERWGCGEDSVSVDLAQFAPGGAVAVEISCTLDLARGFAVFPAHVPVRSRAVEPLEPFRALQP